MSVDLYVFEFGMGVDVHGDDPTKAAIRAVSDAIRHSSLEFIGGVFEKGGKMLVTVTIGVPGADRLDLDAVKRELPYGEVTVNGTEGGLRVPNGDAIIACASVAVSIDV